MKRIHFDNESFVLVLDAVRASKKLNWKQVGAEADVSPSTLCRVLQGKNPDADSLSRLVNWCGVDFKRFIAVKQSQAVQETNDNRQRAKEEG